MAFAEICLDGLHLSLGCRHLVRVDKVAYSALVLVEAIIARYDFYRRRQCSQPIPVGIRIGLEPRLSWPASSSFHLDAIARGSFQASRCTFFVLWSRSSARHCLGAAMVHCLT